MPPLIGLLLCYALIAFALIVGMTYVGWLCQSSYLIVFWKVLLAFILALLISSAIWLPPSGDFLTERKEFQGLAMLSLSLSDMASTLVKDTPTSERMTDGTHCHARSFPPDSVTQDIVSLISVLTNGLFASDLLSQYAFWPTVIVWGACQTAAAVVHVMDGPAWIWLGLVACACIGRFLYGDRYYLDPEATLFMARSKDLAYLASPDTCRQLPSDVAKAYKANDHLAMDAANLRLKTLDPVQYSKVQFRLITTH